MTRHIARLWRHNQLVLDNMSLKLMNFTEFFKYIYGMAMPKAGIADVTVVRRYETPSGYIGELYVNGRQIGVTCDNFIGAIEIYRQPINIGYDSRRVLKNEAYLLTMGEFTSTVPLNVCYVGSSEPMDNDLILGRLVNAVNGCETIRLSVLNRIWAER